MKIQPHFKIKTEITEITNNNYQSTNKQHGRFQNMSSKKEKLELTAQEKIDRGWEILKERDNKLMEDYLKLMRDRDKREQMTKEKNVNPKNGRWQSRTVLDSEGKVSGKIGYSSRRLNFKI
jgi:hypothetical protein